MDIQDYGDADDAGGFFDDYVEQYEQQRAATIEELLEDIEYKLYCPDALSVVADRDQGASNTDVEANEVGYPRYFDGIGYAAHHDGVDDAEVLFASVSLISVDGLIWAVESMGRPIFVPPRDGYWNPGRTR
jgi:hypothetical protein